MRNSRGILLPLIVMIALFGFGIARQVHAADITVINTSDSGAGSLRQAIADAAAGNVIDFSVSGTITLTTTLTINKNLTITGPGADRLNISGNNSVRVFNISSGVVNISGLSIANGSETSTGGGGVYITGGTITFTNCTFDSNDASGVDGGAIFIDSGGSLQCTACTFSNNSADFGAAVSELSPGTGSYTNCTFSGNNAGDSGGALYSEDTTLLNCTIAYNTAGSDGGALQEASTASITNCIISNNTASTNNNTSGSVNSGGYNVVDNSPTGWSSGTGDQLNTNPLLNALANNGGTTQTHSLQGGSPALNPASSNGAPTTDQRGYGRSGNADVGAYELSGGEPEIAVSGNATSISDGDTSPDTSDHTDFGSVDTASGNQDRTFTITNSGSVGLEVYNVIVSGTHASDFTVTTQPTTPVTSGGGTTTFTVRFDPSADGVRNATLTMANNDGTENPFNFDIRGTGTSNPSISGNAGVAGATLSYNDGGPQTATADGSGDYSFTVSNNWSGTVTPSMTGYTFTPPSRTYSNVTTNQTSQDYVASAITYTISGNAGIAGATLSYNDGGPKTATADGSGNYSFTVSYNWSGTVTPSMTGYTFTPSNRTYTNVLANQTSQDYTANAITYTISGNADIAGATLSYNDGGPQTATADGSGNYSFTVSYNWSGTVTPSMTGYTFTPSNRTYSNVLANQTSQNYTANAITYTISGNAGIAGATLSYNDGGPQTATADGSGNYSFTVSYNWSGTVTPSMTGYTFTPTNRTYTNVLANQTSQDYTANAITPTISGSAGVAGATLSYNDGGPKTATADGSGNYSFTVTYNWSGTVTPSMTGYTFTPPNRTYSNVITNQTSQNYTANAITYTISGSAGVAGATLSYNDGGPKTATADGSGNYSFTVSYDWSGTVTPSMTGYTFTPPNRTYSNVTSNQTSQDYTANAITPTISGNAGVAGATLSYSDGGPQTATADGSGNYSFTVSYDWSGTVTPSMTGYTFTPPNRTYSNVTANQTSQDYTANAITPTISGNAGVAGATLNYNDGGPRTATADGSGNYSFTVTYDWSGTVTPSMTGYTFTPPNRTYSNVTANQTSQDYTANAITYTISGNAGVGGATLSYDDGGPQTATADGSGNYSFTVSYDWSGTATPSMTGYTFTPSNRTYNNVTSNQSSQDYTASAPEMDLAQGVTAIADGGGQDFGTQIIGSDTDLVFTITNSGSADLALTTPIAIGGADAGEFSLQTQPTSPVTSGGGTTTFTVRFTPTSSGAKTATISIANNDLDENPYDITITGTGSTGLPILNTTAVSSVTDTTAKCGGAVSDIGSSAVTARGVCWAAFPGPTILDNSTVDGSGAGAFTSTITGLDAASVYYVRAYATNSQGTAYGNEQMFTTSSASISVAITNPADGDMVSGMVTIEAAVNGSARGMSSLKAATGSFMAVTRVEFYIDNTKVGEDTSSPYEYGWDTSMATDGNHTIKAMAYGSSNETAQDEITVTVDNGTAEPPEIALNHTHFNYGVLLGSVQTGTQTILVDNTGGGKINWSVSASEPGWLSVSPGSGSGPGMITAEIDPTGLAAGAYTATITVEDPNSSNKMETVAVKLEVYGSGTMPPFGYFETPVDNAAVCSSVPVTGWALDDIEVTDVKIYRSPLPGEPGGNVYIGDAAFVDGARPEVEAAFPYKPFNYRGGWVYMLLTNYLPNQGNGTFTLHAVATDKEGYQTDLGSKTIVCDNANAVKPFGAIDTPTLSGTVSGNSFVNWGWVLTPQPNSIPMDGSTINVWVDGVKLGNPVYNIFRSDIADLFPGYANSNGAAGYFYLDTTAYVNGVHTIAWSAMDSAGNTDGVGSRYFSIVNVDNNDLNDLETTKTQRTAQRSRTLSSERLMQATISLSPVSVTTGYDAVVSPEVLFPDASGISTIVLPEDQRVEIHLNSADSTVTNWYGGSFLFNGMARRLPLGSFMDIKNGIFYWQPGPPHFGEFLFAFAQKDTNGELVKKLVRIIIVSKF